MHRFYQFAASINPCFSQSHGLNDWSLPSFQYAGYEYPLDEDSQRKVFEYLARLPLFLSDFGLIEDAEFIVGFSFGDGASTNTQLARVVDSIHQLHPQIPLYLQQEIAHHCQNSAFIALEDEGYQTTLDVAQKAQGLALGSSVGVVAQAWHAKRCVETCQSLGLHVVALRVINHFPFDDPQPWVRNPINWVIKESLRETIIPK
ncbi:hypothetical protein EGH82_11835 [Vibrio ponticus]|uniref:Uncharacterized protein n=1 Tax=Vibrio ponticus TaxID=265668 RepID=A0A3N3DZB3_9VIBR|nr:hypothetical protein [Vibrio ponticus]ROV59847.1 hypothetical protein EGH82_11835 [Vibrio ponticus]